MSNQTIVISNELAELITELSKIEKISEVEVMRKAIATEAYFQKQLPEGSKVLVQFPNGQLRELIFR